MILLKTCSDIDVSVATNLQDCIAKSDIVITATSSKMPLITADMVHPGLHITAMGSDAPTKNEISPDVLSKSIYIADKLSQTEQLGELRSAREKKISPQQTFKISQLLEMETVEGVEKFQRDEMDITLCDLTVTGIQDTAIANHAFRLSKEKGFGSTI